jgi:thiamine biosynthesis lipoprotein
VTPRNTRRNFLVKINIMQFEFRHHRESLLSVAVLLAWACACPADEFVISGPTMGTTYHVRLVDADKSDESQLRAAIEPVLTDIDRRLSTYRQDSEISRFNRAPANEWFAVSPATAEIVAASLAMGRETGGALDVTVGPLIRLWHFGPEAIAATSPDELVPPDDAQISAARKLVGHEKLQVRSDPPALRKTALGLEVDLSAVGEGHAIDRIAAELARRGEHNFLIELGGEICARGHRADGSPWRVAVARPSGNPSDIETAVPLANASLATSGDYQRYFEHNGRRFSHIIDPTTGRPIEHKLAAVTVVADDSYTADVWDTAILVLGPDRGFDVAVEHGIAALLISHTGADGKDFVAKETPAWQQRFPTAASSSPAAPRKRLP